MPISLRDKGAVGNREELSKYFAVDIFINRIGGVFLAFFPFNFNFNVHSYYT